MQAVCWIKCTCLTVHAERIKPHAYSSARVMIQAKNKVLIKVCECESSTTAHHEYAQLVVAQHLNPSTNRSTTETEDSCTAHDFYCSCLQPINAVSPSRETS